MNIEQWGSEGGNEEIERMVNEPMDDRHSGEHLIDEHGDAGVAIQEEFGVDPEDKHAMLAKFRELSRATDTVGAAQLHNLYLKWREESAEGSAKIKRDSSLRSE